jgi:hypothetical protein
VQLHRFWIKELRSCPEEGLNLSIPAMGKIEKGAGFSGKPHPVGIIWNDY